MYGFVCEEKKVYFGGKFVWVRSWMGDNWWGVEDVMGGLGG